MLKDGLVYTESRMGYEQEFLEDLTAFDLKSANGTFRGGPVSVSYTHLTLPTNSRV